jgi:hypothetical protein
MIHYLYEYLYFYFTPAQTAFQANEAFMCVYFTLLGECLFSPTTSFLHAKDINFVFVFCYEEWTRDELVMFPSTDQIIPLFTFTTFLLFHFIS